MTSDGRVSNRLALALAANACMFIFGIVLLLLGTLLPSIQVTYAQAGNLGAFPLAGIWVATVLVGPFLDMIGVKPALLLALLLVAAPLAVMSFAQSYSGLAVAAFIYGLGGGLLNTATNAFTAELHASGRASALNFLGFSFSLGALTAPLLTSSLAGLSTATVLRLLAALTALIILPVLLLHFPPASRAGTPLSELLRVLNRPALWLFGLLLLFESANENCMFVWSGKILTDSLRALPQQASLALAGLTAALGAGRLAATVLLRKLTARAVLMISAAITAAAAAAAVFSSSVWGMTSALVIVGLGMSAIYPTALGAAGDCFPQETGTAFGAVIAISLLGGIAGPKVAGALAGYAPRYPLWIPFVGAAAIFILSPRIARGAVAPAKH